MTDNPVSLKLNNIDLWVEGCPLVRHVNLVLSPGELVVLIGPNGAGKTSLLRAATGLMRPQSGEVILAGQKIDHFHDLERAKLISYLPQSRPMAWPNLVEDVVALGRYPYSRTGSRARRGGMGQMSEDDMKIVSSCMAQCDITHLRHRAIDTLSGGEQARVHCARIFAAQTPLLVADEPISALDPRHQHCVMDLLQAYVAQGNGALVVMHDIALAARYATRLVWMQNGEIVADGTVTQTLTQDRLRDVFRMNAHVDMSSSPPAVMFQGPA